jgi:hypothetical protein
MEDDIVSVRLEDGVPMVDPGVPELRLNPDVVDALEFEETKTYADDGGTEKCYHYIDDMPDSVPLETCYVLNIGDTCAQSTISGQEQLFTLVNSTYTQGLLNETAKAGENFRQCAAIVSDAEFRYLTRPDDIGEIESVVGAVTQGADY